MTSDERIDVAERLRKARGIMAFGLILDALGIDLDSDWCWTDVSRRVADLIDPSTSATTFTPGVGLETYPPFPIRLWKCARCGEETIMMYDEGEPVACPYCGAVVVSDDD